MVMHMQHRMEQVSAHTAGAEEWACPTCGRRLLLHARPSLGVAVLATGNTHVAHFGGLGSVEATAVPHPAEASHGGGGVGGDGEMPIEMLRPWLNALRAIEDEGLAL